MQTSNTRDPRTVCHAPIVAPRGRRTTLILPVPAAEPAVGLWRERHDGWAARGIPAHITIVSPFLDPGQVDGAALRRLAGLLEAVARPQLRLSAVGWVGGVVYLKPEDTDPLQALAHAVEDGWPELRRRLRRPRLYHLTVARRQGPQGYRRVREALSQHLPLPALLEEARLYAIRDANDPVLLGRFRVGSER